MKIGKEITVKGNRFYVSVDDETFQFSATLDDGENVTAASMEELRKAIADKVEAAPAGPNKKKLAVPVMKIEAVRSYNRAPGDPGYTWVKGTLTGIHGKTNMPMVRWGNRSVEQSRGEIFRNLSEEEVAQEALLRQAAEAASEAHNTYLNSIKLDFNAIKKELL